MNGLVSRRGMLLAAAVMSGKYVLVNSGSFASKPSSPIDEPTYFRFSDREVTYLTGGEPEFRAAADSYFPSLLQEPAAISMLRLAVLVVHNSGPGIRALSTAWNSRIQDEPYKAHMYQFSPPWSKGWHGRRLAGNLGSRAEGKWSPSGCSESVQLWWSGVGTQTHKAFSKRLAREHVVRPAYAQHEQDFSRRSKLCEYKPAEGTQGI